MTKVVALADFGSCKSHPGGPGFEDMMGSGGAAGAWHWERPGEAIGENAATIAVKGVTQGR